MKASVEHEASPTLSILPQSFALIKNAICIAPLKWVAQSLELVPFDKVQPTANLSWEREKIEHWHDVTIPLIWVPNDIGKQRASKAFQEIHGWIDDPANKDECHNITRILEFSRMFEKKYGGGRSKSMPRHW